MLEFLRDPVWQFIGAFFGLVAIFFIWRQRRNKLLSYYILANSPLFSVKDEISGKLQVLFDEKPVENVYFIVVKIFNSGNIPIKSSDYEYPVNFNFGEKTNLLSAEVIETKPSDMKISASIDDTRVLLTPTLMNEKDSVTVKILADQFSGHILVEGRIVGIKAITKSVERKFADKVLFTIIGLLAFSFGLTTSITGKVFGLADSAILIGGLIISIFLAIIAFITLKKVK